MTINSLVFTRLQTIVRVFSLDHKCSNFLIMTLTLTPLSVRTKATLYCRKNKRKKEKIEHEWRTKETVSLLHLILISTNRTAAAVIAAPCALIYRSLIKTKPVKGFRTNSAVIHLQTRQNKNVTLLEWLK